MESEGSSWYNGLEASLTKNLNYGIQFLAAYTFSKTLDTDGANINGTSAVGTPTLGDQNSPGQRWGRASFDRNHRFVFSSTWTLPQPAHGVQRVLFANWFLSAVVTVQSGTALTIADTNSTNVYGISEDRAQLSGACSKGEFVKAGSIPSKLNSYFNASCFANPGHWCGRNRHRFWKQRYGVVSGPGQANLDVAISRSIGLNWPVENSSMQFRVEFFNAFNHPQFANPDSNFTSPTFGVISSTSVNPRVGQLAIKLMF